MRARLSGVRDVVLALAATVVLAVALAIFGTWPLATCLDRCIVDPSSIAVGWIASAFRRDVDLVTWVLAWDAHALLTRPTALFDANVFHPAPRALATTEHMLGLQVLYLPLALASRDPVWAHQATLLATFAAAFVAAFALVRAWTGSPIAAVTAGILYAFNPFRARHLAMLPMEAGWLLPLLPLAAERVAANAGPGWIVVLATALALQALSSYYVGYASVIVASVLVVTAACDPDTRRRLPALAVAVLSALAIVAACSLPYLRMRAGGTFPPPDPSFLAATSGSFGNTGAPLAAVIAVATLPWWRSGLAPGRRPLWLAGVALAGLSAHLLALGPAIHVGSIVVPGPYALLARLVPGWDLVRAPARLNVAATMAAAALAGIGIAGVARRVAPRSRVLAAAALVAALGVALLSVPVVMRLPIGMTSVTGAGDEPPVYAWLARADDGPVLELPFRDFHARHDGLGVEARRMRLGVRHWRPLLGGYSGYVPPSYPAVGALARALPDERALELLVRTTGVRWIVLHRAELDRTARRRWAATRGGLRPVAVLDRDVVLEPRVRRAGDLVPALLDGAAESTPLGTRRGPVDAADRRATVVLEEPIGWIPRWGVWHDVPVRVTNRGGATWPAMGTGSRRLVMLAYRWLDAGGRTIEQRHDAGRLPWDVGARETVTARLVVQEPGVADAARLVVGVVQDGEWFDGTTSACFTPQGGGRPCGEDAR